MPSSPGSDPNAALERALETLVQQYQSGEALGMDPLVIPAAYPRDDQELISWIAAHLAYGRVAPMLKAIEQAVRPLGASPTQWLRDCSPSEAWTTLKKALDHWKWRFHSAEDLIHWILAWKRLDDTSGCRGLEPHLLPQGSESPEQALSRLIRHLRQTLPETPGLRFNLPDPQEGAACKRWRLFLRWMTRRAWPDLGLWSAYPRNALVIPLDTHVARTARQLGLTSRKTPDGRMALEITAALRTWAPEDPLRYDFAISHLGILGDCPRRCGQGCPLDGLCADSKIPPNR